MRKITILTIAIALFFILDMAAIAHNKVVVVPLGGKGYEPQNPLVISAADFRSDGDTPDSIFFSFSSGRITGNANGTGCVVAPAYIPDGVTVTELSAIITDNDPASNIQVNLRGSSLNIPRDPSLIMAGANSSGFNSSVQNITDSTIDQSIIDAEKYTYYVTTCVGSSNISLYAVKIHYSE